MGKGKSYGGEEYEDVIVNLAKRFDYSPATELDDLVQLARIKIFKSMSKFNPEKSSKKTWIINIVRNYFIEIYRMNKRIPDVYPFPYEEVDSVGNTNSQRGSGHGSSSFPKTGRKPGKYEESFANALFEKIDLNRKQPIITPEEEFIWKELTTKIRAKLSGFEKLVFDCKISPEEVYDNHPVLSRNLCERAHTLNLQREFAIAKGRKISNVRVVPNNKLIANHLSELLKKKVLRQTVEVAMRNIKTITLKYTYL